MSCSKSCFRVGFWISEKKTKKLNFDEFETICGNEGIELIKLDLSQPLEDQGPFDVIVHKLTDQVAKAEQGDSTALQRVQNFQTYVANHPEIVVLDPLDKVYNLMDRGKQYELVQDLDIDTTKGMNIFNWPLDTEQLYLIPAFVELPTNDVQENIRLLRASNITFPIVCKPTVAQGPSWCHEMAIIFNEANLSDIKPPCVAQSFIPHNALLHKVFVLGDQVDIVERPSLKNFRPARRNTIYFDSHDVSKPDSASVLNELSEDEDMTGVIEVDRSKLIDIAKDLQIQLQLELFGIDVIIDRRTGQYNVIDINAFPGYEGIPDFFHSLLQLLKKALKNSSKSGQQKANFKNHSALHSNFCIENQRQYIPPDHAIFQSKWEELSLNERSSPYTCSNLTTKITEQNTMGTSIMQKMHSNMLSSEANPESGVNNVVSLDGL